MQELRNIPLGLFLICDRGAKPDVLRQAVMHPWVHSNAPHGALRHFPHVADTLREQEPIEARRLADQSEEIRAPLLWDLIVEYVRERRAEYPRPLAGCRSVAIPLERLAPVRLGGAPSLAFPQRRVPRPLRPRFRVAVIACRADLLAADPRIERVVGPLDLAVLTHRLGYFCTESEPHEILERLLLVDDLVVDIDELE